MGKRRFTDDSFRKEPWFRALSQSFLRLKTEEEVANFLRDIGTLSELQAFSERLEVAKQLSQGSTYRDIAENTGASTTTVTRVAKFLENGCGGYRQILGAHRHHRLVASNGGKEGVTVGDQNLNIENTQQKNISVLQKYLGRMKK